MEQTTIFNHITGNLVINNISTKIRFVVKMHREIVELTSVYYREILGCFPGRAHFIGMISNVVVTPELVDLLTDHTVSFSVSGHVDDDKLICNKLNCTNCFFVGGQDADGKRLSHMIRQNTACELVFIVKNPNEDILWG